MKVQPYRFSRMQQWFGPSSFAALHIGHEEAFYISLVRKDDELALKQHASIRLHKHTIGHDGITNEAALLVALREMKKVVALREVALVIPSHKGTELTLREIHREQETYKRIARAAGFRTKSVVYEEEALAKHLAPLRMQAPELFVHVGKTESEISIVSHGVSVGAKFSLFGGENLTHLLAQTYGLMMHDAETIKQNKGLKTDKEGKILSILTNAAHVLKEDIDRTHMYWSRQMKNVDVSHEAISHIKLLGSESVMPGLPEYLSHSLRMKVDYIDAWQGILDIQKNLPHLSKKDSLDYIYALGGVMSRL